ncbi:DUF6233 domain-containing protein [Streptomyces sp. NBC_01264]|uniref:DUF6233 domain-containing protein n=1 Tax=Streptomyces sp. NBC_01264 TaxID=2903804 RepID=UPI003D2FAD19
MAVPGRHHPLGPQQQQRARGTRGTRRLAGRPPRPPPRRRRLQPHPTRTMPAADGQAWTLQDLPHRPGHPGAHLIHIIGCHPGAALTLDQALDALRQPRTVPCHTCKAATSLPTPAGHAPPIDVGDQRGNPQVAHGIHRSATRGS